jgi:hypothetical protein
MSTNSTGVHSSLLHHDLRSMSLTRQSHFTSLSSWLEATGHQHSPPYLPRNLCVQVQSGEPRVRHNLERWGDWGHLCGVAGQLLWGQVAPASCLCRGRVVLGSRLLRFRPPSLSHRHLLSIRSVFSGVSPLAFIGGGGGRRGRGDPYHDHGTYHR